MGISPREMRWYRASFFVAVVYNTIWGTAVILFPRMTFQLAGMEVPSPVTVALTQCIGMFVLVYAVGYYYLWRDPLRFAPFALVAVLGKVFGPIGWVWAYHQGALPAVTGWTIVSNDLLWWPIWFPFVYKTVIRPALRRH
jgi:small multidrug resistance pump